MALTAAVAVTLLLGGCRAGERAAATGSGAQDPLVGIEVTVGAVERDLDTDAAVADR